MIRFAFRFCLMAVMACLLQGRNSIASGAQLIYDGNFVKKAKVMTVEDLEYIQLKSVATLFKGRTQWYPIARKIVFRVKNQRITFSIDSRYALIGKNKFAMSGAVEIVKGKAFVPIEFFLTKEFSDVVDCDIEWHSTSQILAVEPHVTLFSPRIYSRSDMTRIVVESVDEVSPNVKKRGDTLIVSIPRVKIAGTESFRIRDRVIKTLKVIPARKGATLKIVLAEGVTSYAWHQEERPPRFVLEVRNPNPAPPLGEEKMVKVTLPLHPPGTASLPETLPEPIKKVLPVVKPKTKPIPKLKPVPKTKPKAKKKAKVVAPTLTGLPLVAGLPSVEKRKKIASHAKMSKIVIDAGHGGEDPGAIGRLGTKEKDINLRIALKLARALRIEGGYQVALTRSEDIFIPLVDRSLFANKQNADLFISIHCNASLKKNRGGFEIYFLAENASDAHARATAEFENVAIQLKTPAASKKKELQELLFSMVRNEFINESSLLCHMIERSVKKRVQIESRGVKQANFHVLHGVAMPSVLIETAFITYPAEEKKLRKRRFRSALVDAILTGVQGYQRQVKLLSRR